MKHLDLSVATLDELAILAKFGDAEASNRLWELSMEIAAKVVRCFQRRYPWVDSADLEQNILCYYPKVIRRYLPGRVKFGQYCYHSYYRAAQDELRKLDPLGISIPQRAHYPSYSHFCEQDNVVSIEEGLNRLDRKLEWRR